MKPESRQYDKFYTPNRKADNDGIPIIGICHLSWNWVWQRPQQFLSRLSSSHPLLFVETYCSDCAESYLNQWCPAAYGKVTVLEMHLPSRLWSDEDFIDGERRRMLREYLRSESGSAFAEAILWFNDPMAVTAFAGHLGERMIVYDCMDELTQFKGAPAKLGKRERELTLLADVIFCGGRRMRDKRLPLNANCHFYGTGVDCGHFARAMDKSADIHPLLSGLTGPVLGYFGVIDERIDYELLSMIADTHPNWNLVMIGPFAKVKEDQIPRRPNLHWLGSQAYADLPALTRSFDVCIMPFALNAATEYINPTKALEYMAAGKPVVSTALCEVLSNFGSVCRIAWSHTRFITYCKEAIENPSDLNIREGLDLSSRNTWEAIAAEMNAHIEAVLAGRDTQARNLPSPVIEPAYV